MHDDIFHQSISARAPWLCLVLAFLLVPACTETSTGAGAGSSGGEDVVSDVEDGEDGQISSEGGDTNAEGGDTSLCECQENDDCADAVLAGSACREKLCDTKSCACVVGELLEAGTPCDDGNICSTASTCTAGVCSGELDLSCEDGKLCTTDSCDAADGCLFVPIEDTDCCLGGVEQLCDDANPCTLDTCALEGCVSENDDGNPCDDGDGCTINDLCEEGSCAPGSGLDCDDGDACTQLEGCVDGACVEGKTLECDDDNACTIDSCSPAAGCVYTFIDVSQCDDGNQCTSDGCDATFGCQSQLTLEGDCEDGNLCTEASCDPVTGCIYVANAVLCEDSDSCTVHDTCTQGICTGVNKFCSDGAPCTDDFCNPDNGECVSFPATGAACDDGLVCNGVDICSVGACVGSECSCTSDSDCPDDANACNGTPTCETASGTCQPGVSVVCDSGVAASDCELVQCIPSTGACAALPAPDGGGCDDGSMCTWADSCVGGECAGLPVDCDDGNPCSAQACDPSSGACLISPSNGEACDDGDVCTGGDLCLNYACIPGLEDLCPGEGGDPTDTDGDGVPDEADPDDDNDGVPDGFDAFPKDPDETEDTDGDGIGDNADPDDDNDGVPDGVDAFPKDPDETVDTDGDGIGDNADPDDDNDGILDVDDPFPTDPTLPIGGDLGCCEPSEDAGCSEESCETCVCAQDPYCCETQWDVVCVSEVSTLCDDECSCTDLLDCCSGIAGTPGCESELCEACVCSLDSDCCDEEWTPLCGVKAAQFCSEVCLCDSLPGGGCCESGSNQPGCGEKGCQDCVCSADSLCCDVAWDANCVDIGAASCALACGCEPTGPVDCCAPFAGVGCANEACEDCVCPGDPVCCSLTWDQACADAAQGEPCADFCGCEVVSNCCSAKVAPGCDTPACEECVCALDSVCCDTQWDLLCITVAGYTCEESCLCELDLPAGDGDCCAPNGTAGCEDPGCQGCVCDFDPFCCSVIWDANCAEAAETCAEDDLCPCDISPPPEKGSCCEINDAVAGCDEPECESCVCDLDSLCCAGFPFWDAICVTYAEVLCTEQCTCASESSEEGDPGVNCCEPQGSLGCGDPVCEACVCGSDAFCCEVSWDPNCAQFAGGVCVAECGCP